MYTRDPMVGSVDLLFTLMSITAYLWFDRASILSVKLEQEMEEVASVRRACHLLLSSICDAVVELDAELKIAEDVHRLGSWLLHGRKHTVQGREMQHFLHSEPDREAFLGEMNRDLGTGSATVAAAFHLKMRDGSGHPIPAECFHVKFCVGNKVRHLLGLREYADNSIPKLPTKLPELRVDIERIAGGDAVMEFNAMDFKVRGATQAFCDLFHSHRLPHTNVTDYLAEESRNQFLQDISSYVNQLLYSDDLQAEAAATLPLLASGGRILVCSCNLTLERAQESPDREVFGQTFEGHYLDSSTEEGGLMVLSRIFINHVARENLEDFPSCSVSLPSRRSGSRRSNRSTRSARSNSSRGSQGSGSRREKRPPESGDLKSLQHSRSQSLPCRL
ncbi:unnamed protein product [Effrenium voratum]|uniref:Uncharacterized protein n=1 Tax=Effrenium voratum TaxID=2562239 RepID=A0AA36ILU8_9DINO|nr:unnamed protein product [Effrenium voratum]